MKLVFPSCIGLLKTLVTKMAVRVGFISRWGLGVETTQIRPVAVLILNYVQQLRRAYSRFRRCNWSR